MSILIRFMTLTEVKQEKSYIESLINGYRRHNTHGVYNKEIEENEKRFKECEDRIEELENGK